jgi:Na+-driven multidrug efflux pump
MFIALLRKVFLLIPLALIFPVFWGVEGIYAAEPVADFTAATTTALVWAFRHKAMLYGPHAKEKKT